MNLTDLQPQQQGGPPPQRTLPTFGTFLADTVSGLINGYTTDTQAFMFITGIGLNATNDETLRRIGKGLMAYSALITMGNAAGAISNAVGHNLNFIGAVIRDNPIFFEKSLEIQRNSRETGNE